MPNMSQEDTFLCDYEPGDEVEYCGPDVWVYMGMVGPGPHFCTDRLPPPPDEPDAPCCATHGERHPRAEISGTDCWCGYWCAFNWRKVPKGFEVEYGKYVERILRSDPVAFLRWAGFDPEPWQEEALRTIAERYG